MRDVARNPNGLWNARNDEGDQDLFCHYMAAEKFSWGLPLESAKAMDDMLSEHRSHDLKIKTSWYEDLEAGRKTAEVRYDDRLFEIGDEVILHEIVWENNDWTATGRLLRARIGWMMTDEVEGVEEGYVVLFLKDVRYDEVARP